MQSEEYKNTLHDQGTILTHQHRHHHIMITSRHDDDDATLVLVITALFCNFLLDIVSDFSSGTSTSLKSYESYEVQKFCGNALLLAQRPEPTATFEPCSCPRFIVAPKATQKHTTPGTERVDGAQTPRSFHRKRRPINP